LSSGERERYSRQLGIDGWGERGQEKLKQATVFVAGCGGLGSPVLFYLAAAGVGILRVCDDGILELSNLNRQVLYTTADIGMPKAEAAARRLAALNPDVKTVPLTERLETASAERLIGNADLVVDCLDNFRTRDVLNRSCVRTSTPYLHAGVEGMSGQLALFKPPETACLGCVIPAGTPEYQSPPAVAGAAAGVLGTLQAAEALKELTGVGDSTAGRMTIWDGITGTFDHVLIDRDPDCPVCGRST